MSINKETLKRTWLYIHCRKLFLWPIDFYRWYPKHLKWLLMAFQKNCMIDPCSRTRAKIWKLCGVDTTGKFNVGYDVYFDAQNAKHLHIEKMEFGYRVDAQSFAIKETYLIITLVIYT